MIKSIIKGLAIGVLCASSFSAFSAEPITIGQSHTLESKIMAESRQILISLPDSYHNNKDKQYPVLYLLDGETHFHQTTGIARWLSESASKMPEMIIVGVPNTNRGRDLSPTLSENGEAKGAQKFMTFFEQELIPYVEKQYRTAPYRVLTGHSMAGMFGLNVLATKPALFDGYILMSPWLLSRDPKTSVLTKAKAFFSKNADLPKFLYITIGEEPDLHPSFEQLTSTLKHHGAKNLQWQSKVIDGASHMSVVGASVNEGLQAAFADLQLDLNSVTAQKGVAAIVEYYKTLSNDKYGFEISPQSTLSRLGRKHFDEGKLDDAIEVFEYSAKRYPDSIDNYFSLSFLYQQKQNFAKALQSVDKAIALAKQRNLPGVTDLEQMKAGILQQQSAK